jgi:hypothetical protein
MVSHNHVKRSRLNKALQRKALMITTLAFALLPTHAIVKADELSVYAQECDAAIGAAATVKDFQCDQGTLVPDNHPTSTGTQGSCDEPNRLNKQCDPGSRFQVLTRSDDAYVVAHCRKIENPSGGYRDIAVIQYNRKNGATCFYQALGDNLPQNMPAPSGGQQSVWLSPHGTAHIGCAGCHDNGPFIRSPYLNQVHGVNQLPGSDSSSSADLTFNNEAQPYSFVGRDFTSWKTFNVHVAGNQCLSCHALGVSNVHVPDFPAPPGTARDFAERATSEAENSETDTRPSHKNVPSHDSPLWMPPHPPFGEQLHTDASFSAAAKQIRDCAIRFNVNAALPDTDQCRITLKAQAYQKPQIVIGSLSQIYKVILIDSRKLNISAILSLRKNH